MGENLTGEAAQVQAGASDPVPAMANYFGCMDAFNPQEEQWLTYVERLEMFSVVNNVSEDKKAQVLLPYGWKDVRFVIRFNNPY